MRKTIIFLSCLVLMSAYAQSPIFSVTGSFYSLRLERELNFYAATHPLYPTNHFYVGATKLNQTNMLEGLVYWKEEGLLLSYTELNADASHDIFAWQGHEWKLGRDTVGTPDEINGSDYLITAQQWHDWVNQCVSKGKLYVVLTADAQRIFPNTKSKSSQ
jgi:hypothetical protein